MLPIGQARVREVSKRQVAANGRRESVALYFISGLDLQPSPIWLDARQELFASGGTWLGVVCEGFETTLPELLIAQSEALSAATLDVRLGRETTEAIAAILSERNIPFLFYTGQTLPADMQARWPDSAVIVKPVLALSRSW